MFKSINQYSPEAYRAEQARSLPINQLTSLAQPLQKSNSLSQAIPERWLNLDMLKDSQALDKDLKTTDRQKNIEEAEESRQNPIRFDSEMLRLPCFGRFGWLQQLLTIFWGLGHVGIYFFLPLSVVVALVFGWGANSGGEPFWYGFALYYKIMIPYIILPCFIAYKGIPLFNKWLGPRVFGGLKPQYEFNRTTGRVKIYHAKSGELLHDFPFTECVAETWAQVGHQGLVVKNTLNIRHYQNAQACIEGGRIGDEYRLTDSYATWNFIQCYMDTSQPLPDIPALEIWRSSDPATITRDRITQRNPRFWRDMTQEEAQALFDKQAAINLAQPEPISSH